MWSPDVRRLNKRTWREEPVTAVSDAADPEIEDWKWQDVDKFRAVLKTAGVPVAHIEALVYFVNLKRVTSRVATPTPAADAVTVQLALAKVYFDLGRRAKCLKAHAKAVQTLKQRN